MRVLLFDWTAGGHHEVYLERCAEALAGRADVVLAAPDATLGRLGATVSGHGLGAARPALDHTRPLPAQSRAHGRAELGLMRSAIRATSPTVALHLYADPILRPLAREPRMDARLAVLVFTARRHYGRSFGARPGPAERTRALFQDLLVRRFAARPEAAAILTLDPVAARIWSRAGRPAHWFPEPPVRAGAPRGGPRDVDWVIYGSLAPRKGIELVADAFAAGPATGRLLLAGPLESGYRRALDAQLERIRAAGVEVVLQDRRHDEAGGLAALGRSRTALLAYPRHHGMSRVLLEAAVAGTPVVAHRHGLIGALVRQERLGVAVDCHDPAALRAAVLGAPPDAAGAGSFASRFSESAFQRALADALGAR